MLTKAAAILRQNKDKYAELMALEMGKPIKEGAGEIEKCAGICEYYALNAEKFLAPEDITDGPPGQKNVVKFVPLGTVLIVMFSARLRLLSQQGTLCS